MIDERFEAKLAAAFRYAKSGSVTLRIKGANHTFATPQEVRDSGFTQGKIEHALDEFNRRKKTEKPAQHRERRDLFVNQP